MVDYKIAALVVTYNRLEMLKECIAAIYSQTYKNIDIVVVNNGSTDGTKEYLDSNSDIVTIHQDNCGGAGGFYSGMKYMYEHDYDALWMMDDDGIPADRQLEYLVSDSIRYKIDYANALVINKIDNSRTAANTRYDKDEYDKRKIIWNKVSPFNGTLVWRHVIEKIGFIKKEMFIWGDETEYTNRVKYNNFKVGTITRAIHYHPPFKGILYNVIPYIPFGRIVYKPRPKDKIYIRNLGYIDSVYKKGFDHV